MIIHNSGLPPWVLYLFLYVNIAMGVGWFVIKAHQSEMDTKAIAHVQEQLRTSNQTKGENLQQMINAAKGKIAGKKNCKERFFSKKAAHGIIMVVSWCCIAGRIPASDQSGNFTCHTYPMYKPINATQYKTNGYNLAALPWQALPLEDIKWLGKPWDASGSFGGHSGWTVFLLVLFLVISVFVGGAISWWEGKKASMNQLTKERIGM